MSNRPRPRSGSGRPFASPPEPAELVRVYPGPKLVAGAYLPGVGIDGALVSKSLANEWIGRGLAVEEKPAAPAQEE